jgi:D-alanine-D-alanine ligase-like ATP-grasp enzyme
MADNVAARCVHLATALRLPFAGIDLRFAPDGRIFCFEVNPSPGFSYYESNTGQPIAMAVAKHLAGLA